MKKTIRQTRSAWITAAALAALIVACWTPAAAAKEPIVSAGIHVSGFELELHLGSGGVFVGGANNTTGCSTIPSLVPYFGGRYFFGGPQDNFYVGAAVLKAYTLLGCTIVEEGSLPLPIVGYHWLWDSGFNLDLGLRPGLLVVGYSF